MSGTAFQTMLVSRNSDFCFKVNCSSHLYFFQQNSPRACQTSVRTLSFIPAFPSFYLCAYICVCMHDKGGAEAQIWLRWSKAPKWKIMCFTPIQLSSHKTTISVISQAPVSVQEQQQCQQWVSAPYKLTLGGWRWLFIPVHAYYLCLPSCTSIIYRNEPKPYKGSCRGRWKNITHIQHPQTSKGNYRFLRDWNQQCLMKNFSHTGY